jgi:hypothetical protein
MALSKRSSQHKHDEQQPLSAADETLDTKGSAKDFPSQTPGALKRHKGLSFLRMLGLGSLFLALLVLSTQIDALRDNHPLASLLGLNKGKHPHEKHSKHSKHTKKDQKTPDLPAKAPTNDYFDGVKSRIVAVGDFHGDWDSTFSVLKMAGLVDESENWIAGKTRFVQTVCSTEFGSFLVSIMLTYKKQGDIVDRGPDTIRLYKLMMKLTKQAKEAGGAVFSLLGNHEIMNMMDDLRYVDPGDTESFGGEEKRKEAWSKDGWLGHYLRSLNITVQVDETVFVHGGIHPDWAKFGVEVWFLILFSTS